MMLVCPFLFLNENACCGGIVRTAQPWDRYCKYFSIIIVKYNLLYLLNHTAVTVE